MDDMRQLTIYCGHDEPNLCSVSSTRKVRVNLLLLGLVEGHEAVEDVVTSGSVIGTTLIVREVVLHGADGQLLLETIDLVEEENDGCLDEPPGVANGIKQSESFLHTVNGLIFEQQLVVLGDGNQEKDRGDIFETVDPLLPFGTLTTDVEHPVCQIANDECGFSDTGSLHTGTEDILVCREIIGLSDALDGIKVAGEQLAYRRRLTNCIGKYSLFRRVVQLVFPRPLEALLHTAVAPQSSNRISDLRRKVVTFDLSGLHEDGLNVVLVTGILERQFQRFHRFQNDSHRLNRVTVDNFLERLSFVTRVSSLMDQFHLLQNCRLARLSRSCIEMVNTAPNIRR